LHRVVFRCKDSHRVLFAETRVITKAAILLIEPIDGTVVIRYVSPNLYSIIPMFDTSF
jgi:hypothetical protein